jgi:hypothetical protein
VKAIGIYILQALSGAAGLAAACATLAGADLMVQQFDAMGLGPWFRLLAASIELIAGLMLIIPRAGALGAVVLARGDARASRDVALGDREGVTTNFRCLPGFDWARTRRGQATAQGRNARTHTLSLR